MVPAKRTTGSLPFLNFSVWKRDQNWIKTISGNIKKVRFICFNHQELSPISWDCPFKYHQIFLSKYSSRSGHFCITILYRSCNHPPLPPPHPNRLDNPLMDNGQPSLGLTHLPPQGWIPHGTLIAQSFCWSGFDFFPVYKYIILQLRSIIDIGLSPMKTIFCYCEAIKNLYWWSSRWKY